jgi:MFS family permease
MQLLHKWLRLKPDMSISSSTSIIHQSPNLSFSKKPMIPLTIWLLGAVMCLINISFVVIYSLSALYLNVSLGVSTIWIGLLEGAVEACSFLMKLCSGLVSDYLRRRKRIMVIGYFFTVISKPILALSTSFGIVFAARLFERLGNGIQATPRDAMVGDIAPVQHRGASFGLMRSLGTAGSFCGGLLGVGAMWYTNNDFQQVFWIASIPALAAFTILMIFVKEPKQHVTAEGDIIPLRSEKRPIRVQDLLLLGKPYWMLMIVVSVFMIARVSETLMVLHAHNNFGLEKTFAPIIMSMYNFTYCLSSYPSGRLADRFGRHIVLICGIIALIVSDLFLCCATSLWGVFFGVFIWGIQMGVVHNSFVTLIADYVPEDLRGTGFGFYYLIGAVSSIIAGFGGGTITHHFGVATTFFFSMIVAILSLGALLIFCSKTQKMVASSSKSQ